MAERSTGRRWPWFLLATGLLAASVGGAAALWLLRAQPEPQEPPPQAPYVELAHARATAEPLVVEGNGIVQPRAEIALSPQVGGRVEYVHPALVSGGAFSAGEVLVRIEDEDYRSRVRQAEATVAQRDVDLQRAREEARIARQELSNLRDRHESGRGADGIEGDFVPSGGEGTDGAAAVGASGEGVSPLALRQPQIQAAEAALQAARAERADATLALDRTTIEAPFSGRVRSEDVDVGQYVQPGAELARIYADDVVEVVVPLTGDRAALIPDLWSLPDGARRVAASVSAEVGGRRHVWDGYVHRAKGFIDERSRTVNVVVRVADPFAPGRPAASAGAGPSHGTRPPLLVGTYATVRIEGQGPDRYLSIPAAALRRGEEGWALRQGDDGQLRLEIVPAEVILRTGDRVAVRAPRLPDGALLVTSTLPAVTDGMAVRARAGDGSRAADGGS